MSTAVEGSETPKRPFDENKNGNRQSVEDYDHDTPIKKPKVDTGNEHVEGDRKDEDDQQDDLEDNASIQIPYGGIRSKENEILKPKTPEEPVKIGKNPKDDKYVFPKITKEDTQNARMFLKYYGLRKFLDTYLPEELNSLYVYYLIKLLGFELKDKDVLSAVLIYVSPVYSDSSTSALSKSLNYEEFEDPDRKSVV